MTPFENLQFFLWLLIPLLPAVLMGFLGVRGSIRALWLALSTLGMLYLTLRPISTLYQAIGFFVFEWLLVQGYLAYRISQQGKNKAWVFYTVLAASLVPLVIVKFSPFWGLKEMLNTPVGFLGISYVTFRTVGTVIEIRDGLIKRVNLLDFTAFVLFFPTLASGPIDRYRRFREDLDKPLPRSEYAGLLAEGLDHIFRGFLYKFVIAYLINKLWLQPASLTFGFKATVNYMYAYSFYLFFDFAGYSAFAVGVSYILGIRTPENFNKPFISKNIKDFWNRWHISLSYWFRDFVYMRFVMFAMKKKWSANRATLSYLGYLLLFLLQGLWHGPQLHYIVYGLFHASMMIGFEILDKLNKKLGFWGKGLIWDSAAVVVTVHFVMFSFLIFSGRLF